MLVAMTNRASSSPEDMFRLPVVRTCLIWISPLPPAVLAVVVVLLHPLELEGIIVAKVEVALGVGPSTVVVTTSNRLLPSEATTVLRPRAVLVVPRSRRPLEVSAKEAMLPLASSSSRHRCVKLPGRASSSGSRVTRRSRSTCLGRA